MDLPVAGNIRFWTPQELRDQADMLEEFRRQAAVRRDKRDGWQYEMFGGHDAAKPAR